jgi:outer membrane receptor protein involved in Fe transport
MVLGQLAVGPAVAWAESPALDEEISLESLVDIVVTATLREQSTLDAPASIQVVNAAEIRARGYRTLKQIMNDVPGFNDVADTNEEIGSVRGVFTSTTNKILIMVNGHRMNDLMLGRYNTDQFLGLEAVERIEFIRGPASALYGTGALVGIVNIITLKGADFNGTQLKAQGGIRGQEASASFGRQVVGYDVFFNFTYLNALGQTMHQASQLDVAPAGGEQKPGDIYLGRYRENMSGLLTLRSENSSGPPPRLERQLLRLRQRALQALLHGERLLRGLLLPLGLRGRRQEQAHHQPQRTLLLLLRAVVHHLRGQRRSPPGPAQRHAR